MIHGQRELQLRRHIIGVLASHSGKTLSADNIGLIAESIVDAAVASEDAFFKEAIEEASLAALEQDAIAQLDDIPL
jgi:hypothetical protein